MCVSLYEIPRLRVLKRIRRSAIREHVLPSIRFVTNKQKLHIIENSTFKLPVSAV